MAMRERGYATRVQIPPARQLAAWRLWRVCSDAAAGTLIFQACTPARAAGQGPTPPRLQLHQPRSDLA
jgi:hypothetical protein